ncbi:hypothetical protein SLA2020_201810 [Shorea laevis]
MALMQQLGRTKNVAKSSEVSVRQQLNQFLKTSKRVYKWEVGQTLRKLCDHNLYYPALKLSENMAKTGMSKTVSDQAIHLDLVAKARGIPAAENYFIELSETSKNIPTYGSLLNCYCKELMTEKAEALVLTNSKDVPGAEKCFREWESSCSTYDIRVVNVLMGAYAQELKEKDCRRGGKPNVKTGRGNGEKWVPSSEIIGTLMEHFEQEKDVDGAESFLEILKKAVEDIEKVEASEATKKLLDVICVE